MGGGGSSKRLVPPPILLNKPMKDSRGLGQEGRWTLARYQVSTSDPGRSPVSFSHPRYIHSQSHPRGGWHLVTETVALCTIRPEFLYSVKCGHTPPPPPSRLSQLPTVYYSRFSHGKMSAHDGTVERSALKPTSKVQKLILPSSKGSLINVNFS
jgi:hypothetical protein